MANPQNRVQTERQQNNSSPYLRGDEVHDDPGIALSVFALQEIIRKVRESQTSLRNEGREVNPAPPEIEQIFSALRHLRDERPYRIERTLPTYYRFESSQSQERFFRVDSHFERIAAPVDNATLEEPARLMSLVSRRVDAIRDAGSFLLYNAPTHFVDGREIIDADGLGVDVSGPASPRRAEGASPATRQIDQLTVLNQDQEDTMVDTYPGACPDAVFRVHRALTAHVVHHQRDDYRNAMQWLQAYGEYKRIDFSRSLLTDVFSPDTVYIQSYHVPANPQLLWEVPRCGIPNLRAKRVLGVPHGTYITPNPRITSITIASRVTTTTSFAQLLGTIPTAAQMDDVRKIYLALMFPNQILLDIRSEPGHQVDVVAQSVAGVLGKLLFSYGPALFNITPHTPGPLIVHAPLSCKWQPMIRRTIRHGPSGRPLDFVITQGQRAFDCNQLAQNPARGNGYAGWGVDAVGDHPTPYPHVRRRIQYLGYVPEDVIDERFCGDDLRYPLHQTMCEALAISGHVNERNYVEMMRHDHVVRFAHLSQVINRDLVSALSLPDERFNMLAAVFPRDATGPDGPLVLDISYMAIIHAFRLRFLPVSRPERIIYQPMLESVYASHLSLAKLHANNLQTFVTANSESFVEARPLDTWRAVYPRLPEPVRQIFDLTGQHSFVTGSDIGLWLRSPLVQDSLFLLCARTAWQAVDDPADIGFTRDVYIHRQPIPGYPLEDVRQFRRDAVYFTNMLEARPANGNRVILDRAIMQQRAGAGRLRMSIRELLDDGLFVQIGIALRPNYFEHPSRLPPEETLRALPFEYRARARNGPTARVTLQMLRPVSAFFMLYNADEQAFPDEMIDLVPKMSLVSLYIQQPPVERVSYDTALSVINRDFVSFRSRVRLMDLSAAFDAGSQYALPSNAM
uniref:Structural core protein VP2 n=1 Tax=Broadhaven virus TaxID=10893 RepID=VP2_BRD|nr:RecName: Full=Structural core protein VP2 [Broadhaven virus]